MLSKDATLADVDTCIETISAQVRTAKGKQHQSCKRIRIFKIKKGLKGNIAHSLKE